MWPQINKSLPIAPEIEFPCVISNKRRTPNFQYTWPPFGTKMLKIGCILSLIIVHIFGNPATRDDASVADLLKPLTNFQIIFHLPLISSSPANNDELQKPLQEAVNYLQRNGQPIQLSFPANNVTSEMHLSAGRHMENRVIWFVFVRALPDLVLDDILSCQAACHRLENGKSQLQ